MEIYLDNSATTKVCPEACAAASRMLSENYGNPSAVHSLGIKAGTALADAREKLARVLSCAPEEVYFSHSGTLANNTAIYGAVAARSKQGNRIVTTAVEHPSVARVMDELENRGYEIIRLRPTADGSISAEQLAQAITPKTILVSIMYVNNETGAINPVDTAAAAVKKAGAPALIHVDAIQAFGKLPVKPSKLGIDLLSVSGHKIHAPKGIGALYIRKGLKIKPYVSGGGQENNMFSGTENMPAIAGFGAAAVALPDINAQLEKMKRLRNYAVDKLSAIECVEINSARNSLPYIINMSAIGIPSQVLINYLSGRSIYVSAGSACKKGHRSEVLSVMGFPPARIDSAIRVSMSRFTTEEEIDAFVSAVDDAYSNLRHR